MHHTQAKRHPFSGNPGTEHGSLKRLAYIYASVFQPYPEGFLKMAASSMMLLSMPTIQSYKELRKMAKIRNRYNQIPPLILDTR